MKKKFLRILVWVGIVVVCAVVAAMLWQLFFNGSLTVHAQKWLQVFSVVGMFMLPPVICGILWNKERNPFRWLKMDQGAHWSLFLMAIGIMVVALPGINLLAEWNSLLPLPNSLAAAEEGAEATIKAFLQTDQFVGILANLGLMALLPAVAEEMTFRGTLQQIMAKSHEPKVQVHTAIWVTAILFSAIHMQFLGFVPRMLMGAMFGYMFVWTGTLWIPILMHFVNNAIGITLYYILPENSNADTFGAGTTWYIGILSLILTSLGLLIFYRRTHKQ